MTVQISTGPGAQNPDGSQAPSFATPGAITASVSGDVLTVTNVASGVLQAGQTLSDAGALLPATTITSQLTGTTGGLGTYLLSQIQPTPIASEAMTTALNLIGQVQALSTRDLHQTEGLNLQGEMRALYVSGTLNGVVRVLLKGGDLIRLPDGTVWLVTLVPEPWGLTAGWTKCVITLQNGN